MKAAKQDKSEQWIVLEIAEWGHCVCVPFSWCAMDIATYNETRRFHAVPMTRDEAQAEMERTHMWPISPGSLSDVTGVEMLHSVVNDVHQLVEWGYLHDYEAIKAFDPNALDV